MDKRKTNRRNSKLLIASIMSDFRLRKLSLHSCHTF